MYTRGCSRLALIAVFVALGAVLAPAASARASANPWTDPSYTPTQGNWQPYVLAPSGHQVSPASVLFADPRQGSISGDPNNALATDGRTVTLTSTGSRDGSPLLALDFGKEVAGKVEIRVTGASGNPPALHACFSESRTYMALRPGQNNGETALAPGCDTANIWNGFPGVSYTWDSDSHALSLSNLSFPATITDPQLRGGFRYLTLFLDGPGSVAIDSVSLHLTAVPRQSDPAAYRGHFLSSDNTLNKIWYAGAYTVQINTGLSNTAKSWPYSQGESDSADAQIPNADPSQEVIYDGGKRDRDVWQGDLSVQMPVTLLSTDDTGAVDNSLSALAAQQLSDGYVPAEGLVGQHNRDEERTYGEYVTWFVNNMAVHYLYTGDKSYLDRWYPALTRAMAWLESVRQQDPQGLIAFASTGSCGHYGYSDCGHETYVNALYYRNLEQMAMLADAEGQPAATATYRSTADAVKSAINSQLWDDTVGAYRLSRETPDVYPQDANATAILTGIADQQHIERALTYLRDNNWARLGSLTTTTSNPVMPTRYEPLSSGFEVEARLTGQDPNQLRFDTALQLIRNYWGWNLSQDPGSTFWEKAETDGTATLAQFTSLAHGWAAAPTIALTTQVLGISPTAPGYSQYAVIPHPASLAWAQGTVPTPHGDLAASWQRRGSSFALSVTAPTGATGELAVPTFGQQVQVRLDGKIVWNAGQSLGQGAHSDGTFVYLENVAPGTHKVTSQPTTAPTTTVQLTATPLTVNASPGSTQTVTVTVAGSAAGKLSGTLEAVLPVGWVANPQSDQIEIVSNGRPVSQTVPVYVYVPDGTPSGDYPVHFTFTATDGTQASAQVTFHLSTTKILYGFEDGTTQGWQPDQNVTGVSAVTSLANGPGHPYDGNYALDAACAAVSASDWHTVQVSPSRPLDLTSAQSVFAYVDGYGGAPGATGYEAQITLTASGGQTLTNTVPISNDSWNKASIDVSGWAYRNQVSRIDVGFHAVGSTFLWSCHFQVDDVGWTG